MANKSMIPVCAVVSIPFKTHFPNVPLFAIPNIMAMIVKAVGTITKALNGDIHFFMIKTMKTITIR